MNGNTYLTNKIEKKFFKSILKLKRKIPILSTLSFKYSLTNGNNRKKKIEVKEIKKLNDMNASL